jgi:hypothetical protein
MLRRERSKLSWNWLRRRSSNYYKELRYLSSYFRLVPLRTMSWWYRRTILRCSWTGWSTYTIRCCRPICAKRLTRFRTLRVSLDGLLRSMKSLLRASKSSARSSSCTSWTCSSRRRWSSRCRASTTSSTSRGISTRNCYRCCVAGRCRSKSSRLYHHRLLYHKQLIYHCSCSPNMETGAKKPARSTWNRSKCRSSRRC